MCDFGVCTQRARLGRAVLSRCKRQLSQSQSGTLVVFEMTDLCGSSLSPGLAACCACILRASQCCATSQASCASHPACVLLKIDGGEFYHHNHKFYMSVTRDVVLSWILRISPLWQSQSSFMRAWLDATSEHYTDCCPTTEGVMLDCC